MFNSEDYEILHSLVFRSDYPGYKPDVREAPNGDGKIDTGKRYAHVNRSYLDKMPAEDRQARFVLEHYLKHAHAESLRVATALDVPDRYLPDARYGTLRVLEYPAGIGGGTHTDMSLFTLKLHRNDPEFDSPLRFYDRRDQAARLNSVASGLHIGEIGEILGLGKATPHEVLPQRHVQHALVYFAIPDHDATLDAPSGGCPRQSVGFWLTERVARSRY